MAIELMCRKIGMTQIFDDAGQCVPVTVLEAGPNSVVRCKTQETDGYSAVQLGFGERRQSLFTKPQRGHFEKANVAPKRYLKESRLDPEGVAGLEVGQDVTCAIFEQGQLVDVIGETKGRGTTGVVKRHGFAVKKRTHGTHEAFRHGGSIGAGAYPGRVIKGLKMAGRLGAERITMRNLEVVRVDPEQSLLFVRGGVPGHRNALVRVRTAVRPGR